MGIGHLIQTARRCWSSRRWLPNPAWEQVLKANMAWLRDGQDARPTNGVAGQYRLSDGWTSDYPETSGYIIPTFRAYAHSFGDSEYANRAIQIGRWLVDDIQAEDGSIPGGLADRQLGPAFFDTGQVLFGLCTLAKDTGDDGFIRAAHSAADWLTEGVDGDGRFVRGHVTDVGSGSPAFYVRSSWAMARFSQFWPENDDPGQAAGRSIQYVVSTQNEHGWFPESDLHPAVHGQQPLTHSIAYVLEGVLEVAVARGLDDGIASIRCACDGILPHIGTNGFLAGRLGPDWSPKVPWSCLTGSAQIAIVLLRLHQLEANQQYLDAAKKLLAHVTATVPLKDGDGLAGGLWGSVPYCRGGYLGSSQINWGAKFLADALMLWMHVNGELPEYFGPDTR